MKTNLFTVTIAIVAALTLVQKGHAQESNSAASAAAKTETTTATSAQKADTEWEGVSVELQSVTKGAGDTITIKFKYTNSGSRDANIAQLSGAQHDNLAEHAYYVDPGNKKKYLVVKDAQGKAIASNLQYLRIGPGSSHGGWAKFPAPPSGVSKIDVYLPGAPPFEGVAIASQ